MLASWLCHASPAWNWAGSLIFLIHRLFPISKDSWTPLENGYENMANSTESVFDNAEKITQQWTQT